MSRVLGVFAKAPRPGEVKSRLAAVIGADLASRLYHAFLRDLLPRLTVIDAVRILAYASPADHVFFHDLCASKFELECQCGNDLGDRMSAFFQTRFAQGAGRVALVGSDSPSLPLARIEHAFSRLNNYDVVLGPSDDGGYYLIGLRRFDKRIFEEVDWSTNRVFDQTMDRLAELGLSHTVLEPWYDIDVISDLTRLRREIDSVEVSTRGHGLDHTAEVLRELNLTF